MAERTDGGPRGAVRATALAVAAALVLLVAAIYHPVRAHEFLPLDDRTFIVESEGLRAGLSIEGLRFAFRTAHDGSFIPLTWISFLVDESLHGLSPGGTHVTNAVLHAAGSVWLLAALLALGISLGASAFVAGVFAAHPVHVESVAWAIERKDVLSGVFFGAALWAHARHARRPRAATWLAVSALGGLGMLAKPMLVTLPFVLLLLDTWPLRRLSWRAVAEKAPLLAASAALSAVTLATQAGAGAVTSTAALPPGERLAHAVVAAATYLRMAVWPAGLAVFYPRAEHAPAVVAGCAALLAGLTGLALWQWRRRPVLAVGWLWFGGMLVPVIGLVQVGLQSHADRYLYLPLTGVVLAVALAADEARARVGLPRAAAAALGLAAVAALALASHRQLAAWRDGEALYERALAVTRDNAPAHNGLGFVRLEQGRVRAALEHFEAAVRIEPGFREAHANLGAAWLEAGEAERALRHLEAARGLATVQRWHVEGLLGLAKLRTGAPGAALGHFETALREGRPTGELHLNAAAALLALGRPEEGLRHVEAAERGGMAHAGLEQTAARLHLRAGEPRRAAARLRRAIALDPGRLVALNDLAWLLATSDDAALRAPDEAVALAERAVALDGGERPVVLDTLAEAYAAAGRVEDARRTNARALAGARAAGDDALVRTLEARAEALAGERREAAAPE